MKKRTYFMLFLGLSLTANHGLFAQDHSGQVIEKMKSLSWILGDWNGEAWYMGPDREKHTINQHEHIVPKLDGSIFTAEGTGSVKVEGTNEMKTVFRAFGIFTWDLNTSSYVMRAYRDGNFVDSELVPNDDGSFSWFIEMPYGKTRYTLRLKEDGSYNEKGEFSPDGGQTWMQTFEMTLIKE